MAISLMIVEIEFQIFMWPHGGNVIKGSSDFKDGSLSL